MTLEIMAQTYGQKKKGNKGASFFGTYRCEVGHHFIWYFAASNESMGIESNEMSKSCLMEESKARGFLRGLLNNKYAQITINPINYFLSRPGNDYTILDTSQEKPPFETFVKFVQESTAGNLHVYGTLLKIQKEYKGLLTFSRIKPLKDLYDPRYKIPITFVE